MDIYKHNPCTRMHKHLYDHHSHIGLPYALVFKNQTSIMSKENSSSY